MMKSLFKCSDSDDRVFRLASPVISASFQCDTCTTSNLSTPVQVTFNHTQYDQVCTPSSLYTHIQHSLLCFAGQLSTGKSK